MSKKTEPSSPEARLPKGLFDISAGEIRATEDMLATIRRVFESYGFEPLDTPAIEYTDALGKFLPDQDRPNEGVFSFKDDDEQWLSLRYDLTAPLARYVAENFQSPAQAVPPLPVGPGVAQREAGARAASANSPSSTPIRSAPRRSPPTPNCACSPPTRWRRSASRAANTSSRSTTARFWMACLKSIGLVGDAKRASDSRCFAQSTNWTGLGIEGSARSPGKGT